jgi:hypothetical protein
MKEPNIKSTNLTTLTISGQDSSDARKRVLDQLKEVDINSQGLVTNARCLTEGVDVPTLDGIAFIDPRASQVDIVQAVGRAIRKGGDEKKFGYIVIPIFFPKAELNEEIIDESAFKPIWDVINALKSHDSLLANSIDSLRIQMGNQKILSEKDIVKISLDLPIGISPQMSEKIQLTLVENISDYWYFMFGKLLLFVEDNNHCRVPQKKDKNDPSFELGRWVAVQRMAYNKTSKFQNLTRDQINKLESLKGWSWSSYDSYWDEAIKELKIFYNTLGHANVSKRYVSPSGFKLGRWVGNQRTGYLGKKRQKLSTIEIQELGNVKGWTWNTLDAKWEEGFNHWQNYVKAKDTKNIQAGEKTKDGFPVGNWYQNQYVRYRKNIMLPERRKRFKQVLDS